MFLVLDEFHSILNNRKSLRKKRWGGGGSKSLSVQKSIFFYNSDKVEMLSQLTNLLNM